jgi:hypothetical protein
VDELRARLEDSGTAFAHVLIRSAHRRAVLVGALRSLGADVGSGDPLEWERAL